MRTSESVTLETIGVIHSSHRERAGVPIQPRFAEGSEGSVEVFPKWIEALKDIDGFERIWIIYVLDRASPFQPHVVPFRDVVEHGVLATRSPPRPNPIGMSTVRLLGVEGGVLRVADVDVLDGTPLLDIKPYVPVFDSYPDARAGWVDANRSKRVQADDRFDGETR